MLALSTQFCHDHHQEGKGCPREPQAGDQAKLHLRLTGHNLFHTTKVAVSIMNDRTCLYWTCVGQTVTYNSLSGMGSELFLPHMVGSPLWKSCWLIGLLGHTLDYVPPPPPFRFESVGGLLWAVEFYLKSCTVSLRNYWVDPFGISTQTLAASWNISFLPLVGKPGSLSKPAVILSCSCSIYTNRICVFSIHTSLSCTYISLLLYINYLYTVCTYAFYWSTFSIYKRSRTMLSLY